MRTIEIDLTFSMTIPIKVSYSPEHLGDDGYPLTVIHNIEFDKDRLVEYVTEHLDENHEKVIDAIEADQSNTEGEP